METTTAKKMIIVSAKVDAPVSKVWEYWTRPEHITQWNQASDDWHTPWAKNDLRVGGTFSARMEAKDGSFGFEFSGVYDELKPNEYIEYTMADGRKVKIKFEPLEDSTAVTEEFEAENTHSIEMQRTGWQAIMDNFKKYTENN